MQVFQIITNLYSIKCLFICVCELWSMKFSQSCLTFCDPHGLYGPWNSPGQNTGVGSLSLLQGIFPTQGLNPGLRHCRQILYHWATKEAHLYVCSTVICEIPGIQCLDYWFTDIYSNVKDMILVVCPKSQNRVPKIPWAEGISAKFKI